MMREILFRGKRIDNGEFVTGSFCMDTLEQFNGLCGVDGFIRLCDKDSGKMQMYEVDRETVGQFTGLIDKNGKKIFEGDILVIWNEYEHPVLVKFLDFGWHCVIPNVNVYIHYRHRLENNTAEYEVIGNIHDNPELLERGAFDGN